MKRDFHCGPHMHRKLFSAAGHNRAFVLKRVFLYEVERGEQANFPTTVLTRRLQSSVPPPTPYACGMPIYITYSYMQAGLFAKIFFIEGDKYSGSADTVKPMHCPLPWSLLGTYPKV